MHSLFIPIVFIVLISVGGRFFLFLVLDKAVFPFLVKYFEMPIWHPTCEKTLDELLHAKVDLYVLSFLSTVTMCQCLTNCFY